jgi:thiol-disulfide isomerase/thioredoxin
MKDHHAAGDASASPHALPPEMPTLADDGSEEHGRIGYGRFGRMSPVLLGLLIAAVVAGIWWFGGRENAAEFERRTGNVTGELAPAVPVRMFDGDPLSLDDLRGNVVVVNFWASWCGPCRTEAPALQAFSDEEQAAGRNTVVLGVDIRTDQEADALAFIEELGLTYPMARDDVTDQPGLGPLEQAFGIPSVYPATIFIRPDGRVDRYHLGPITEDQLRYAVEKARDA